MFKSDEETMILLSHPNNGISKHTFIGRGNNPNCGGNGIGSGSRLTIQDKADIGVLASLVGNKTAAELLGEEYSAVSKYKNGINGLGKSESGTKAAIANRFAPIRDSALDKVAMLLNVINADKADKLDAKGAAIAAEKMVSIVEKLGPKVPMIEKAVINFYSPKLRESSSYPIIDVEPIVG